VPYGLYRASVTVQRCTLPLPIPLIPLCAVRPVKSLNACTTVHFNFTYTSTAPMCRTVCTVPSVSVQRCSLALPTLLLPLCALRRVQSFSACTKVLFTFTYTSTPPICCTACTELQCLYNGALYLYLYLYCPYVPYGLYSAFSVCTTVFFNFTYTSTPPMCPTTCTELQCLYKGALYLYLYLYTPYMLYGLYRASVPVQRCSLPLPIPLLPLCAVRSVLNLSACTTVHFIFTFTWNLYNKI